MAPAQRRKTNQIEPLFANNNYTNILGNFSKQVIFATATKNTGALDVLSRYNYSSNIGLLATTIPPTNNCYQNNNSECKFVYFRRAKRSLFGIQIVSLKHSFLIPKLFIFHKVKN